MKYWRDEWCFVEMTHVIINTIGVEDSWVYDISEYLEAGTMYLSCTKKKTRSK